MRRIDVKTFLSKKPLIGMVHLLPLPGSVNALPLQKVLDRAIKDAKTIIEGGMDAVLIENYGDRPFRKRVEPITVASMTLIVAEISRKIEAPVGVNVLRYDAVSALSIAHVTGADFIRSNAYTETVATGEGILEPIAWEVQQLKKRLNSEIAVFADILVKHGVTLSAHGDDYYHAAKEAVERGLADAVIVTGRITGEPPQPKHILEAKKSGASVLLGSGMTPENAHLYREIIDGAIVGTYLHERSDWSAPISLERVRKLVRSFRGREA